MERMALLRVTAVLLCCLAPSQGKISEYQLESESLSQCELLRGVGAEQQHDHVPQCSEDGRFRHVQCSRGGGQCWCVSAEGAELPGSRQNRSAVHCLTSCQLHRQQALQSGDDAPPVPQCSDAGEYQPVQCDRTLAQCWCVDLEGMEIYGTRQNGKPSRCPGSCEVRERRLLHGVGEPSPPQCHNDGDFLPVQCKFVNTTDIMVFDLLHTFNRLPEAFQSFSSFRTAFPELSAYCFCADSRGRELPSSGVELLLDEVYDTAFSGMGPGHSFSQSNMYRILQRRFLAVQLAMTGRFRCPSPCESERSASTHVGNVFVPSCDANGAYAPTQCQAGGQCWCVDSNGKEIFGTRQHGGTPDCSTGVKDCPSERRQALSRLFYGPAGHFSRHNVFSISQEDEQTDPPPFSPCSPEFQELLAKSGLLQTLPESERSDVGDVLAEMIQGMFPSGALALRALALAPNPKRLQENLFGGKFLKNAGNFNFTGALGSRGTLSFSQAFGQVGLAQAGGDFMQLAKIFSSESATVNLDREISDAFGRTVNLKNNRDLIKLVGMTLENEHFLTTLREAIAMLRVEDSTQLGAVFRGVFQSSRSGVCGIADSPSALYVPQCTESGQYQEVQCQSSECWCVDSRGLEMPGSRSTGPRPRCQSKCEKEREMAVKVKGSSSAGSKVFIPKCEEGGGYVVLQCLGKSCFCMDRTGARHNPLTTGAILQCPTDCQLTAAQSFLSVVRSALSAPATGLRLSDVHVPSCAADGSWRAVQCDGPPEQAFRFHEEWTRLSGARDTSAADVLATLRGYGQNGGATASFGGFLAALFRAGHHRVFPALARYEAFADLPREVLEGDVEAVSGPSVLLNPLSLWRLLRGDDAQYPGPLSDFNAPLGHLDLRQCWCVGQRGDMIPDTKAPVNQIPKCPGPCALAGRRVARFLEDAEELISLSNRSHVAVGYAYLLAEGVGLGRAELQQELSSPSLLSASLLSHADSALRLAAHSTLHFYWQSRLMSGEEREALLLGYQPYSPQCDAHGQWLPSQCYPSTGHCWCVDGQGGYIAGSLSSRSSQAPQCQTLCQRARAQSLLSDWTQSTSDITSSYSPSCEENGQFSVLQRADSSVAWCVNPITGATIQPAVPGPNGDLQCPGWCALLQRLAVRRETGLGYEPVCLPEGRLFSPLQCDQAACWCVSGGGQELPQTRTPRSTGRTPECDRPQCPLPFGDPLITHGAVLCRTERADGQQRQRCELSCYQGYVNALPAGNFLCDTETKTWLTDVPLPHTCQRPQVLQTAQSSSVLQLSLAEGQQACSSQLSALQASLLHDMRARGLCSLQTSSSGQRSAVTVCDESSVSLECVSDQSLRAHVTFKARLSDLPVKALPDLHDVDTALGSERLLDGVLALIRSQPYQAVFSSLGPVPSPSAPRFGCTAGYQHLPESAGCVVCPTGSFSRAGVCSPCPRGSHQAQTGQEACSMCPPGSTTAAQGAFSSSHCVTECQQSDLRCTEGGDFLPAQQDVLSGRWLCVTPQGDKLPWTSAEEPITEEECRVLETFEAVSRAQLLLDAEDSVVLSSKASALPLESQLRKCVSGCAQDDRCHHVALFTEEGQTRCDLYSADAANIECKASDQNKGFLGNAGADMYERVSCSLKLKVGDRPNLTVIRKKGHEFTMAAGKTFTRLSFRKAGSGVYRTLVFEARGSALADVHRFCLDVCSQESCCDGFILNQNILNGGTVMCGLLSQPDSLLCSEGDWDLARGSQSSRTCGAGVQYNKQRKQFTFDFGGQKFTITDAALPTSSKNKTDYQATIIGFQRVYLWKDTDMSTRPKTSACANAASQQAPTTLLSVKEAFSALGSADVRVDSETDIPSQQYWIFKHQFSAQAAQLWCLKRCQEEALCHVADVRDEGPVHFLCALYPDTRVCGAYDKPLRQACSLVLPQDPQAAHRKKVVLTGSVESFYSRVPFKKMVSYSVRSRVNLSIKPITDGFFECERRCDEDPCCRGIGYVRDTGSPGSDVLCLTLNSLGIQTCGEGDRTSWRVQDCSPSKVETGVYPFGWYEKPVNQWTKSPGVCPPFQLRSPSKNVAAEDWRLLDASSVLTDSSVSTFDIVHISRDIADDLDRVRDWCLAACEGSDSCVTVSVASRESAVRCVLYPDTHTCFPSSSGPDCRLLVKEPALHVYLRKGVKAELTSVSIPGHGALLGGARGRQVGADRKTVSQFLGVPYARPPIAELRFSAPRPAEWSGTWNATFPRASCLQPGDAGLSAASEDCLYLNIFIPSSIRGNASVLVFFHNPSSSAPNGPGLLDASYLAAVGNIVVVTANFRVAAFGFLSTGSVSLPGNYGLQDQAAALTWVQENVALFGGDPRRVTVGAERSGADTASLHLISSSAPGLFSRALLMGGSAFSPASVMSSSQAQEQAASLARELGCSSRDSAQLASCLRAAPAQTVNAAQTKLLAVSGPLQAWAPVIDRVSVQELPSSALRSARFHRVDVMLGASAEDGLISRARNIKNFEELQGRADSKTAFYEALSNSLGGDAANALVKEAATWFYSLQHSPSPEGYSVFSRALDNATRDLFIICPTLNMADFWAANARSSVFMYYLPEDTAQTSADLSMPLDVQLVFGLPHSPRTRELFSSGERALSLQMMSYVANFIMSGNPNQPLSLSRVSFGEALPPWPRFLPHPAGDNYKEVSPALGNRKGLKRAECSFWSHYVPALTASSAKLSCGNSVGEAERFGAPTQETKFIADFRTFVTQSKPKSEKDAYN